MERGSPLGRLTHGISWTAIGAFSSRPLLLAGSMVCARFLDPDAYGKLALLQGAVLTLGAFAGMGMATGVTRHLSELRVRDAVRAGRLLWLTLLLSGGSAILTALALTVFRAPVAERWLAAPDVADLLPITAVTLVFTVLGAAQIAALTGLEAYRPLAACHFVTGALTAALMIAGALSGGLAGVLRGTALAALLSSLVFGAALRGRAQSAGLGFSMAFSRADLSTVLEASVPLLIAGLIPPAVSTVSGAMLSRTSAGYAELGIFSAADQWRVAILFLGRILAQPSLPILTDLYAARDMAAFRRLFRVNLLTAGAGCAVAAMLLALFGGRVMALYGRAYAAHGDVLAWCCAGAALAAVSWVASQALTSAGEYWLGVRLNLLWGVVLLGLCYGDSTKILTFTDTAGASGCRHMVYAQSPVATPLTTPELAPVMESTSCLALSVEGFGPVAAMSEISKIFALSHVVPKPHPARRAGKPARRVNEIVQQADNLRRLVGMLV